MLPKTTRTGQFERTDRRVVMSALVAGLLALLLLWWSAEIETAPVSAVVSGVGAALLPVALITLIYEWYLRKSVIQELLDLVGIRQALYESRLVWAGRTSQVPWEQLLDSFHALTVISPNPTQWLQSHWDEVLRSARNHAVEVVFAIPDPNGSRSDEQARLCGREPFEFDAHVRSENEFAQKAWDRAVDSGELCGDSRLRIPMFKQVVTYSLTIIDSTVVLSLFAPAGHSPGDAGFSIILQGTKDDYPISWLRSHIDDVIEQASDYDRRVE